MNFLFDLQLFAEEKTEPATPRRRQEARRKGQAARSAELSSALILLAGVLVIHYLLSTTSLRLSDYAAHVWQNLAADDLDIATSSVLLRQIAMQAGRLLLPVFVILVVVACLGSIAQVGFLLSGTPLQPTWQRINPLEGFKRMFSKRALVELAKSLLKLGGIGLIVYRSAATVMGWSLDHVGGDMLPSLMALGEIIFSTSLRVVAFLLVIGAADYVYQRWEFSQGLRMSRQEILEELRQSEGDPQLRARMREKQRLLARRRMMQDVPKADVVIVNPVHLAIALQYDPQQADAPVVLAKGQGYLASKIKEVAREHKVAIVEDPPLARTLFGAVDIGDVIPPQFYQAVAEVLAFVFRTQRRY